MENKENTAAYCDQCGAECIASGITTGYGTDADGRKICFSCCGINDRAALLALAPGQSMGMYLSADSIQPDPSRYATFDDRPHKLSNWPGSFSVPIHGVRQSIDNFGGLRLDAWATIEGKHYWICCRGADNSQCARVTRVKTL